MADEKFDYLIVQGAKYKTLLTDKFKRRKAWKTPDQNVIFSFIPGTVIEVMVKTGQKVKEGETIMILEAMKMHNKVLMPFDGEIVKINVKPSDNISKHQSMIEVRAR
jgi:biotin carboxyl carrier protein